MTADQGREPLLVVDGLSVEIATRRGSVAAITEIGRAHV